MERFTTPIPANRMCFWHRAGDVNRAPSIALVTSGDDYGLLDLTIFGRDQRMPHCLLGVRYKNDPYLKKHPNSKFENGTWSYMPGFEETAKMIDPSGDETTETLVSTEKSKEEARTYLKTLREEMGSDSKALAIEMTKFTGEDWTFQRVNANLRVIEDAERTVKHAERTE